jgi:hypothetical protein
MDPQHLALRFRVGSVIRALSSTPPPPPGFVKPDEGSATKAQPDRKSRGIGRDASLTLDLLSTPREASGLAASDPLPTLEDLWEIITRRPVDWGADAIRPWTPPAPSPSCGRIPGDTLDVEIEVRFRWTCGQVPEPAHNKRVAGFGPPALRWKPFTLSRLVQKHAAAPGREALQPRRRSAPFSCSWVGLPNRGLLEPMGGGEAVRSWCPGGIR